MARPRFALPATAELRGLLDEEGNVRVRVTAGAREEALQILDGRLIAKVRAKPEAGKANAAVAALLAAAFDLAPSRVELLRGATSRKKCFRLR
jgi:uncharacterized protein